MNKEFFLKPNDSMQRRYEALRAIYVDNQKPDVAAKDFGFSLYSLKSIKRDCKNVSSDHFFKSLQRGPKGPHRKTLLAYDRVVALRKRNYSVSEIQERLQQEDMELSLTAISAILSKEGFSKLFRRTHRERLEALQATRIYPEVADQAQWGKQASFSTPFGGLFLFLPLIMELKLHELFSLDGYYGSNQIPARSYMLSFLALKLLGKERLSHVNELSFDYGLGLFAGLNVLPKSTAMSSYSYRHDRVLICKMLKGFVKRLQQEGYIKGANINLDFHVTPHYGDESVLEKDWVPTKNKQMKSVLSFFAQDLDTTFLCFSDAEIPKEKKNDEILTFLEFYQDATGVLPERLVFNSKLTTYAHLNELNKKGILFITLKRRGSNFPAQVAALKDWKKVRLDNAQRKYRNLQYTEKNISLRDYEGELRQLIIIGNGRELPMCLITNDLKSSPKTLITLYTQRWRIENNIEENVDFFHLNALSSPVVVKVDFDIAMTLIANTLYKIFATKTKQMSKAKPKTLSRAFVQGEGNIEVEEQQVVVKLGLKSYTPLLKEWISSLGEIAIPWWGERTISLQL